MNNFTMHSAPHQSWQPVADIEGVSLIEQRHFRLLLEQATEMFRVRLLQKKAQPARDVIPWQPVTEFIGEDAMAMLAEGRAMAYVQLTSEGDYIDWDDELSPDLYPTSYCYLCEAHGIECLPSEKN